MASRTSKVFSLSLAQGILMVVNVVVGMVLSRTLTVGDYGTYLQTFLAYNIATPILTMGLPTAMYYFLPGEEKRNKALVLENMLLLFIAGLIFTLFLHFGGAKLLANRFNNKDLLVTLEWMKFYPLYTFPILLRSAVWVTQDKVNLNAKYNVVTGFIEAVILIIVGLIAQSYEAPTIIRIIIPIAYFPICVYLIFKNVKGEWSSPTLASMSKIAKFSIPLGLATVLGTLAKQLSGMVVSLLSTPEEYAIFANGAKEVPFIGIITGSISVVIMADMTKYIKEGEVNSALELFRKSASISASFLFPIMICLMIFSESFIEILYSSKYSESVVPFVIYLFIIPSRIAFYGSALIAFGKTKIILYRSILDLLFTAIFCFLFVKLLGPYGAALGLVVTVYIWSVPYNLFSLSKYFKCKMRHILHFKNLLNILIVSLIAGVVPAIILIFNLNSIVEFIVGVFIYSAIYFILAYNKIQVFNSQINTICTKYPFLKKIISIVEKQK